MKRAKGHDPEPMVVPPLFQSRARPLAMIKWFLSKYMWPQSVMWIALAALMYHFFTPSLDRFASLSIDDVGLLWLRNTVMMLVIIGGQHWWLHIRKAQGTEFKLRVALACYQPQVVYLQQPDPRQHVLDTRQRGRGSGVVRGDHVPPVCH